MTCLPRLGGQNMSSSAAFLSAQGMEDHQLCSVKSVHDVAGLLILPWVPLRHGGRSGPGHLPCPLRWLLGTKVVRSETNFLR